MVVDTVRVGHWSDRLLTIAQATILAAVLSVAGMGNASAYIGDSFMDIPGVSGGWQGAQYKNWIRVDANYWKTIKRGLGGGGLGKNRLFFAGPSAVRQGASELTISIDKHSPVLSQLMDKCVNKTPIAEVTYAESSDRSRTPLTIGGPRPADIPEYFEYKLKDVQLSDCPVVVDAADQAFVVSFNDIQWLNYQGNGEIFPVKPVDIKPAKPSPTTKSFVLTWFAVANYAGPDQCTGMNGKPTEDDYYALVPKEQADKERIENAKNGGVSFQTGQMALRGPHHLDACQLPGIVKDPGQFLPQSRVAHGLNLDGNDGTGAPAPGTCGHKNFVSEDGETGIDNQLFAAVGCVPGLEGSKGFMMQFANNQMHDGIMSLLIQITGIDNEKNDNSVDVTLFYSLDPMSKTAAGDKVLSHYTFRVTDNPEYTHYVTRLHGRIVNGVLTTDAVKEFQMNLGVYGTPSELTLANARMRLKLMPDGTLKGVVGGYEDWKAMVTTRASSVTEQYFDYQCPPLYNALKRAADGLKDPVTGECNGISAAYDIEGIPAFIGPAAPKIADKANGHRQVAEADTTGRKAP